MLQWMVYHNPLIYPQTHNTINNESPSEELNNLTEQMDRLNMISCDVLMEQRSVNHTVADHDDDVNGDKSGNQPEMVTYYAPTPTMTSNNNDDNGGKQVIVRRWAPVMNQLLQQQI